MFLFCTDSREVLKSPPHDDIDEDRHKIVRDKHQGDGNFRQVFFGRLVCLGTYQVL